LVVENKKQGGFVVAESERVSFDRNGRRRAVLIDLGKTKVVTADDFPTPDDSDQGSGLRDSFRSRYGWSDGS